MKVFGIGLNKTGTKTLGICLQFLGFKKRVSYDLEALKNLKNNNFEPIFKKVDKNDCFEDWPWPLMYKILYEKYPDNKFILTIRETPEIWFNSLCKFALRTGPTEYRKLAYGYSMPHNFKEEHIQFYNSHKKSVIEFFCDKPDKLLVVCWEKGDGWEALCSFLDKDFPNIPFPHINKSLGKKKKILQATLGDTVRVQLSPKFKDDPLLKSSIRKKAIQFTIGADQVISGLEEAIIGMNIGTTKTTSIPFHAIFGRYRFLNHPLAGKDLIFDIQLLDIK